VSARSGDEEDDGEGDGAWATAAVAENLDAADKARKEEEEREENRRLMYVFYPVIWLFFDLLLLLLLLLQHPLALAHDLQYVHTLHTEHHAN
jgi:hypothetical protein